MVNIILFDVIFLDVYPALANAIESLTNLKAKPSVLIKRRFITFGIIILIFTFSTFIENWLGASKEKVIG
jgi:hypothetical protein